MTTSRSGTVLERRAIGNLECRQELVYGLWLLNPERHTYTQMVARYMYLYMRYTAAIESERYASATVTFIQFIH
jgi:hypothetical protein